MSTNEDHRVLVHPDDARDRLADMKATGAEFDATVEPCSLVPRGQALFVDVGAVKEAFQRAAERAFLGDLDNWKPAGILGASSRTPRPLVNEREAAILRAAGAREDTFDVSPDVPR
jgi:hypothetical protein